MTDIWLAAVKLPRKRNITVTKLLQLSAFYDEAYKVEQIPYKML